MDYLYRSRLPTLNNELYPWHGKLSAGLTLRADAPRAAFASASIRAAGSSARAPDLTRPNIQLYFSPVSYLKAPPGTRPLMNPDPYPAFLLGFSTCRPPSRGHIEIGSRDPFAPPKIHPNYLTAPEDMVELLDGVRFIRRLAATPSMHSIIEEELKPGPAVQSDEELIDDIRQRCGTVFHPVGTCMMGPDAYARSGRQPTARARARRPAGDRRVGVPECDLRQHQRADHHGGGEGRRHRT